MRFHEANEYILWQGEPHKLHVFVIQQGTVSLWDEADGQAVLRDVRGPGDMLGIERFNDAPWCLHSARSASDVVIYSFPASDFEELVLKYPYARRFVEAHDTVSADFEWAKDTRDPQDVFLHDVVGRKTLESCSAHTSIRDVAALDADHRVRRDRRRGRGPTRPGRGHGQRRARVGCRRRRECRPADHRSAAGCPAGGRLGGVVTDGVLAMAEAGADALAVTSDGSPTGQLQTLVTPRDIARAFGDQPRLDPAGDSSWRPTPQKLRELNHRARALALRYLTSAASLDWVARFVFLADVNIVKRIIALVGEASAARVLVFLRRVRTGRIAHQARAAAGAHRRGRAARVRSCSGSTSGSPTRSPSATTSPEPT